MSGLPQRTPSLKTLAGFSCRPVAASSQTPRIPASVPSLTSNALVPSKVPSRMHKRAAGRFSDVSSGFRHVFHRCRGNTSRPPTRLYNKSKYETVLPVARELRKVLSPEACRWLEGSRLDALEDPKGKKPAMNQKRPPTSLSPSIERQEFDAMASREVEMPGNGDDAFADDLQRIPSGTFVEIRR